MKIFSAPGATFPGVELANAGAPSLVSGLGTAELRERFEAFATFVSGHQNDSLTKAMYDNFVGLIVDASNNLAPGKSLYQIIIDEYDSIRASGNAEKLYAFHLYFYIALYHFEIWYCKNNMMDPVHPLVLAPSVRDYVKGEIDTQIYSGGITIAPDFFVAKEVAFRNAFTIDGSLDDLVTGGRLGALKAAANAQFTYLLKSGNKFSTHPDTTKVARQEIIQKFRSSITRMVDEDVKRFLAYLAGGASPTGALLRRDYGEFHQYAVGEGGVTKAMFGIDDYGLIFFDYELDDIDSNTPCKLKRFNIPVLDRRDPAGTSVCFLYYGLDAHFVKELDGTFTAHFPDPFVPTVPNATPPEIEFHRYCDGIDTPLTGTDVLIATNSNEYRLSGIGDNGRDVSMAEFALGPDAVKCDLKSSSTEEEMVFIVFKNRIVSPRRHPPPLQLTTEWWLPDNQFRKTPTDVQTEVFNGQDQDLASLVSALAADSGFEVYASIEGLGIGRKLNEPRADTGGLKLERASDQSDKPPPGIPAYDELRYAHGWLKWYPDASGVGGWLIFYVTAFVSPLRCTWEGSLQPATELDTKIKPYVPWDSQNRPSYNCVLSSFRAFALFEAMIQKILFVAFTSNDVDTAAYGRIATTLNTYLGNEARVKVLLPTGRLMTRKVAVTGGEIDEVIKLDQAFIDQFH